MKEFFKPEEFARVNGTDIHLAHCNYVNRKLKEKIIKETYSYKNCGSWHTNDFPPSVQEAQISKAYYYETYTLLGEPYTPTCKHEPIHVLKNMCQSQVLTAGKVGFNFFDGWVCRNCGVELKADWSAK